MHLIVTCRVDNDCFLSHICLNNMCVIGCRSNSDCSGSESCIGQRCTDSCSEGSCGPNSICRVVNHQPTCRCPSGMIPNPTPLVGCVREPTVCTANRDCGDGLSCDGGTCRPICSTNKNCFSNEICDKGLCKPICRQDGDCRSGEICEGLTCMVGCRSDTSCPNEHSCAGNKCVSPCSVPGACGTNSICSVRNHEAVCRCEEGLIGNPASGCKAPQLPCSIKEPCQAGLTCIDSVCRTTCREYVV